MEQRLINGFTLRKKLDNILLNREGPRITKEIEFIGLNKEDYDNIELKMKCLLSFDEGGISCKALIFIKLLENSTSMKEVSFSKNMTKDKSSFQNQKKEFKLRNFSNICPIK